jgi:hypothetical protein
MLRSKVVASLVAWMLSSSLCYGALMIRVTNHPSLASGQTLWTFSGSTTYARVNSDAVIAGGALAGIREWKGAGAVADYVVAGAYNNYTTSLVSGSVDISVIRGISSIVSNNLDGLHIDHDSSGDDFGVSLNSLTDIILQDQDILAMSGSAVFAVDFAKLNQGTFQFSDYDDPLAGTLPMTLVVQAVPEPTSAMVGLGLLAASGGIRRLRRRQA